MRASAACFPRIAKEWGVPFECINDGEVTALAGSMSLGVERDPGDRARILARPAAT